MKNEDTVELNINYSGNIALRTHKFFEEKSGQCYVCCTNDKKRKKIYCCSCCHYYVHQDCFNKVTIFCKHSMNENQFTMALSSNHQSKLETMSVLLADGFQNFYFHHWVFCVNNDYCCCECGVKFTFEPGYVCSWCKISTHMTSKCRKQELTHGFCDFGKLKKYIVPPYATDTPVDMSVADIDQNDSTFEECSSTPSRTNSLEPYEQYSAGNSSLDNSPYHPRTRSTGSVLEPVEVKIGSRPILVFVNPKSGGNLGFKVMNMFNWYLNPQQVFDLTSKDWKENLKKYERYPHIHCIVCGGDGSVCWVLSVFDKMNFVCQPTFSVVPLGTGNDLSISLNWGSKYRAFDIKKIMHDIECAKQIYLDRWNIAIENTDLKETSPKSYSRLFQNYFSFGSDAIIALNFHQWRERNKTIKGSRIRNKIHYAQEGTKLSTNNIDVSKYITKFICDGIDYKQQIDEIKPCSILFLNITSYSGGTIPWGDTNNDLKFKPQRCDDKMLEVLLFSYIDMIKIQFGIRAKRFLQCSNINIEFIKDIVMQYDGEPEILPPSTIDITLKNQALFLKKNKNEFINS